MVVSLRIGFIGAGQVNFGGGEGAWDHAARLEKLSEEMSLVVVAIADPDVKRAELVLSKRRNNSPIWKNTQIFASYIEMLDTCVLSAVFIGIPPYFHGSTEENRDVELQCLKRRVHMFIEKPISCAPISDVEELARKFDEVSKREIIVSVGYMFRYSKAIEKVKSIIQQHGPPKAFNARYACAYTTLSKPMWWDVAQCGGPIVEQATHFCDLARFLVGEVDLSSLMAISVKHEDRAGKLESVPLNINESKIPIDRRIPRVTSAFWKFENGAIGSIMHGVLLHESKYECEFEIWGDGYRIVVMDPYHKCRVNVRLPRTEESVTYEFDDDYYLSESKVFLEAVRTGNSDSIKSSFSDAVHSYKLTWEIKTSAERI